MRLFTPDIPVANVSFEEAPPFDGYSFGLLVMRSWVPKPLGHVSQCGSYSYPVLPYIVEGSNFSRILGGDMSLLPKILEAAHTLQDNGCKCITSSCGYFGLFQRRVADEMDVPVYISSLCQIPWVLAGLGSEKKIIVLCYDDSLLKRRTLEACGLTSRDIDRCVIRGLCTEPEFSKFRMGIGHYNVDKAREEILNMALALQCEHPEAAAIVMECTDMPPHAAAVQKATNLPVFDVTTMLDFIQSVVG